jgi:hypothetical protein
LPLLFSEESDEPILEPFEGKTQQASANYCENQRRNGFPFERVNELIELLIRHCLSKTAKSVPQAPFYRNSSELSRPFPGVIGDER